MRLSRERARHFGRGRRWSEARAATGSVLASEWESEDEGSSGVSASAASGNGARGMDSMGGTLTVSKSFSAGKIVRAGGRRLFLARSSSSMFIISVSSWFLNSLLAFLNSAIAFPNCRPNSGSFLGPKMTRAIKTMKIISGMPRFIGFIIMRRWVGGKRRAVASGQLSVVSKRQKQRQPRIYTDQHGSELGKNRNRGLRRGPRYCFTTENTEITEKN